MCLLFRIATRQFQKGAILSDALRKRGAGEDAKSFSINYLELLEQIGMLVALSKTKANVDRAGPVSLRKEIDHGIVDIKIEERITSMAGPLGP